METAQHLHGENVHSPFYACRMEGVDVYVILLRQKTGNDCFRAIASFFTGERLLGITSQLAPRSDDGVVGVRSAGPGRVSVDYAVSWSKNAVCAVNGGAGVDTYVYGWRNERLFFISGAAPQRPKWIAGTP